MANRVYLIGLNENFFEDDEINPHEFFESRYFIPLLWLAMFEPKDIRPYEHVPLLIAAREEALSNFERRSSGLLRLLGEPCRELLSQWREFLQQNADANFIVNTSELAMMDSMPGQCESDLRGYLNDMNALIGQDPVDRKLGAVVQAGGDFGDFPYKGKTVHLCGYSNSEPEPWGEVIA